MAEPEQDNRLSSEWLVAVKAWDLFVHAHPELGFRTGFWSFHNFMRRHRVALLHADAIRRANNRHWIAHSRRLPTVAFACATGHYSDNRPVEPACAATCAVAGEAGQ